MTSSFPGAQVVGRMAAVLRAVSSAMPRGASTADVARTTQLARPTVHRLLAALTAEGFCDHDNREGLWLLGPEMYLMGTVAAERYDITEIARDHVAALAEATGESAFLSVRRGDESVCLLRADGAFPIRSFVLYEGKRFPLGVASAGLVMLSFLPEAAMERYLAQNDLVPGHGIEHSVAALRERITQTRERGWAVNPGLIVQGSWGMGSAVFDKAGQPAWALSLTGIESRFAPERRKEMGELLLHHAHELSKKLRGETALPLR
ncbi:IclR family transcriptional regulator [Paeniglutamicibacter sp. Y32M11]|uniref:IclR family transcriptional regulator n=1 Tax=Paeniglutamicibacter sp. Y32M11 TaxID=2853258 RepID=UPI001C52EC97|nr:IclR family transcriptional regulator [Paeniglutamicibacter sp. Y32M11]QXQ10114.1 IclR family transcriptional regulator [Paeniglutamicibacter sp. Y32M11]